MRIDREPCMQPLSDTLLSTYFRCNTASPPADTLVGLLGADSALSAGVLGLVAETVLAEDGVALVALDTALDARSTEVTVARCWKGCSRWGRLQLGS